MQIELEFSYYSQLIKKRKKMILILMMIGAFLGFMGALSRPVTYISKCSILLPEGSNYSSTIGGYLKLPGLSVGTSSFDIISALSRSPCH